MSNGRPASEESFGRRNPAFPSNLDVGSNPRRLSSFLLALNDLATQAAGPGASSRCLSHRRERASAASVVALPDTTQLIIDRHSILAPDASNPSFQNMKPASSRTIQESFALRLWLSEDDAPWSSENRRYGHRG